MRTSRCAIRTACVMLGTAVVLAGSALAQGTVNCNPDYVRPYGPDFRHVSRNIYGVAEPNQGTLVYFFRCHNEITRFVYRMPITIDLSDFTKCDEVNPALNARLVGYYYSEVRMTDPYVGEVPNTRIGWHYGRGDIINKDNVKIGTASFEGTVSTNSSRDPLPQGVGHCYECGIHAGILKINFVSPAGTAAAKPGTVQAVYQFNTIADSSLPCDELPWCNIGFTLKGTLDGRWVRACPTENPHPNQSLLELQ